MKRFASDKNGTTAIEYAVITAIITIGIITSMTMIGTSLNSFFLSVKFGGS